MEFLEAVVKVISDLGVPVGCLVGAFWLLNKERIDHKSEVDSLRTEHNTTEAEMIKAINNNTLAIEKLIGKLNG